MTLLSAQVPYADIAFIVVLALALILGLIRGLAKSFKGFFLAVAIVLISLLLISPTFEPVRKISVFEKMNVSITEKISSTELLAMPIYVETAQNEDGTETRTFFVEITLEDGTTARTDLGTALGDGIKAKFANWLAERFITEDGQTIGGVAGNFISDIIVSVIMFIVYCIALGLICWLIRLIFRGMHNSDSDVLRIVDRSLGAVVSVALTLVFVLVVLAIIAKAADENSAVHIYLSNSKICGFFYLNNPITELWTSIFG